MHNKYIVYKVDKVSIVKFINYVFNYYKIIIVFLEVLSIALLIYNFNMFINMVLNFNLLYWIGIYLSTLVHEYMHFICMKKFGVKEVEIRTSFLKFSIRPRGSLEKRQLIITSISGALSCILIGCAFYIINYFYIDSITISILVFIYFTHAINLLPIFGDGRNIIKALF